MAELGGDGQEPEIATAEIDLTLVEKIRTEMPLLRRTFVCSTYRMRNQTTDHVPEMYILKYRDNNEEPISPKSGRRLRC